MTKTIFEHYTIDENGNVFSKRKNKYLKTSKDNDGYKYITIKGRHYKIHRLVAIAFIDNPNNKPCIDHIDRNIYNNHISNLRWVTPKENSNNALTIEHLKDIGKRYKTQYGKRIKSNDETEYESIIEAARKTGIPRSNIQYHLKQNTGRWQYV